MTNTATTRTLPTRRSNLASATAKSPKKSQWTLQYEFRLWQFGAYQHVHSVEIGPDAVPYALHTNLLRDRCPAFYRELLRCQESTPSSTSTEELDPFEHDTPALNLQKLDIRMFRIFNAWLYTGQLILPEPRMDTRPSERLVAKHAHKIFEPVGTWRDEDLVDVYLFASQHEIWELANLAITKLWKQNDEHLRTSSLPAIQRAFDAGAFAWDETLGGAGPNQKPYLMRLQDYLLFEAARGLASIKSSWLDLLLTAHIFPPAYNTAAHARFHEPARAIEVRAESSPQPFWEYEPCYFHYHTSSEEQKACSARWAIPVKSSESRPAVAPRVQLGPEIHDRFRSTCTVLLGRGRVPFVLHKELLCHHSAFFNDMFGDSWHGPPNDTVVLDRELPRDFALFAIWLYTQEISLPTASEGRIRELMDKVPRMPKLPQVNGQPTSPGDSGVDVNSDDSDSTKTGEDGESSDAEPMEMDEIPTKSTDGIDEEPERETNEARFLARKHQKDLISLYAFAGRMKMPALRNAVIDKIIELRENGHPYLSSWPDNLQLAYRNGVPDAKLCAFLIQEAAFTYRGLPRDRSGYAQHLPQQFLHDLLEYQFTKGIFPKLREHVPSWRVNLCEFHEHAGDAQREACAAHHRPWQAALKAKGSNWQPIGKEFQSRSSRANTEARRRSMQSKRTTVSRRTSGPGAPSPSSPLPRVPSSRTRPPASLPPNTSPSTTDATRSPTPVPTPTTPEDSERDPDPTRTCQRTPSLRRKRASVLTSPPRTTTPRPPSIHIRNSVSSEAESIARAVRLAHAIEIGAMDPDLPRAPSAQSSRHSSRSSSTSSSTSSSSSTGPGSPPPTPLKDDDFFTRPMPPVPRSLTPSLFPHVSTRRTPPPPILTHRPSVPLIVADPDLQLAQPPTPVTATRSNSRYRRGGIEMMQQWCSAAGPASAPVGGFATTPPTSPPLPSPELLQSKQLESAAASSSSSSSASSLKPDPVGQPSKSFGRHRVAAHMSRLHRLTHPNRDHGADGGDAKEKGGGKSDRGSV